MAAVVDIIVLNRWNCSFFFIFVQEQIGVQATGGSGMFSKPNELVVVASQRLIKQLQENIHFIADCLGWIKYQSGASIFFGTALIH